MIEIAVSSVAGKKDFRSAVSAGTAVGKMPGEKLF